MSMVVLNMELKKKVPLLLKKVSKSAEEKPKFANLREVMDYTRPLSIFYSGVEYESYLDILYDLGIRNFLMSYEYLKGKGSSQLKKYPDMHLFIDSGAFTYMNDPKYADYSVEHWEKQVQEYLTWTERHKDQIFAIADLDLQYLVGEAVVNEWRRKYFEPFMLRTGVPVCFIYHEEGIDVWEKMCQRYPYVGFSLSVDGGSDDANLREKFRIAEKHNSLVQGMASTKTSMLTEFPFYTVDSTTWNVGLKYGEISIWNGTRMSRVKKTEFESKGFPVISRYDRGFDFDLILEEDKTELIRVNAYAFVQAEKYVRERLKAKMYWMKARVVKIDLDNLSDDFFPSLEWFEGTREDAQEYAQKMNLNPEHPQVADMLYDVTAFLNWENPVYKGMRDWYFEESQQGIIKTLHDEYVNRIVPDEEAMIDDLIQFYSDCVSGKKDTLLQLGTNFDRIVKERERYVEDEEEELVDVSPEEIRKRLQNVLPSPEDVDTTIEDLDEEIYKSVDIVPTFDDAGKFVKGQVAVRKPKKVYSKKYPKFACDTCYAAAKCPEYEAGYVCVYQKMFNRFDTRSMPDIIQAMQGIVEHNMTRMQRAMVMETINGNIDPTVSGLMDTNVKYMQMLKQMYEFGSPEVLRQTRIMRADGSQEESTQITNPQSGGILEKLFGDLVNNNPEQKEEQEIIDVTPKQDGTKED